MTYDTLAQELEAIDARLRQMPMPFDLHPAVNDLLRVWDKAGASIIEALRAKTPPEEAVEASKQIWKSMKRAFLKDAGPEYDEIGERIAIPHLVALQPSPEQTEPSATHSEMLREALAQAQRGFASIDRKAREGSEYGRKHGAVMCYSSLSVVASIANRNTRRIAAALAKLDQLTDGRAA